MFVSISVTLNISWPHVSDFFINAQMIFYEDAKRDTHFSDVTLPIVIGTFTMNSQYNKYQLQHRTMHSLQSTVVHLSQLSLQDLKKLNLSVLRHSKILNLPLYWKKCIKVTEKMYFLIKKTIASLLGKAYKPKFTIS